MTWTVAVHVRNFLMCLILLDYSKAQDQTAHACRMIRTFDNLVNSPDVVDSTGEKLRSGSNCTCL